MRTLLSELHPRFRGEAVVEAGPREVAAPASRVSSRGRARTRRVPTPVEQPLAMGPGVGFPGGGARVRTHPRAHAHARVVEKCEGYPPPPKCSAGVGPGGGLPVSISGGSGLGQPSGRHGNPQKRARRSPTRPPTGSTSKTAVAGAGYLTRGAAGVTLRTWSSVEPPRVRSCGTAWQVATAAARSRRPRAGCRERSGLPAED